MANQEEHGRVIKKLETKFTFFTDSTGKGYACETGLGNRRTLRLNLKSFSQEIIQAAGALELILSDRDIKSIIEHLTGIARFANDVRKVFRRVAPMERGFELDRGDKEETRIAVTDEGVEVVKAGSATHFLRSSHTLPFVEPDLSGDPMLIKQYLNMSEVDIRLLIAWLTYTIAHPKIPSTNYLILVIVGGQGTGKSFLSKLIQSLVDPSAIGVLVFPKRMQDLIIAAENSHLLVYDNLRSIDPDTADHLCICCTSGSASTRQLYTMDDMHSNNLHCALVLNGIHHFVNQPDLAERCLRIELKQISAENRTSEAELLAKLQEDLPAIFGGLLTLTSKILKCLPDVQPASPERMIEFCQWLAAFEKAEGIEGCTPYQSAYSDKLKDEQRESLLEKPLAWAMLKFAAGLKEKSWKGTPSDLLEKLDDQRTGNDQYDRRFPTNAIQLSRRLTPLLTALRSQGIEIEFVRGKERMIHITVTGDITID